MNEDQKPGDSCAVEGNTRFGILTPFFNKGKGNKGNNKITGHRAIFHIYTTITYELYIAVFLSRLYLKYHKEKKISDQKWKKVIKRRKKIK